MRTLTLLILSLILSACGKVPATPEAAKASATEFCMVQGPLFYCRLPDGTQVTRIFTEAQGYMCVPVKGAE